MRNQKGFTLIELMIVLAIISIVVAIAIPSLMEVAFRNRFGFDPLPKTPLKYELVWDHIENTLGRACGEAERREREFNERPVSLVPTQTKEWEELAMRSRSLGKQTDDLCTQHARALAKANSYGYGR